MAHSHFRMVLLETSGNQAFVFQTNKLRENIGASQALMLAGTRMLKLALDTAVGQDGHNLECEPVSLSIGYKSPNTALRNGWQAEVMAASSGKALVLIPCGSSEEEAERSAERARKIITAWSKRILTELPGVDATGVFGQVHDWQMHGAVARANKEIHRLFESARLKRTSPLSRFPNLPVLAPCQTSGLPAEGFYEEGKQNIPASWVTRRKRKLYVEALDRFNSAYGKDNDYFKNLKSYSQFDPVTRKEQQGKNLEELISADWLGIIHADGNGLGQLFLAFHEHLEKLAPHLKNAGFNQAYVNTYRKFSTMLDGCGQAAFKRGLNRCLKSDLFKAKNDFWRFPIFPVVVGGDDLTVAMTGELALLFTETYLAEFEREVRQRQQEYNSLPADKQPTNLHLTMARQALGKARIGTCAGVAIIKPHFPFHTAYALAEKLAQSAKQVKRRFRHTVNGTEVPHPCSALDFHFVYDSSVTGLPAIRDRLCLPCPAADTLRLYSKPYVVTADVVKEAQKAGRETTADWLKRHNWQRFKAAVNALAARDSQDPNRPALPATKAHAVRQALFQEKLGAEKFFQQAIIREYPTFRQKWEEVAGEQADLLYQDRGLLDDFDKACCSTTFYDALEALAVYPKLELNP